MYTKSLGRLQSLDQVYSVPDYTRIHTILMDLHPSRSELNARSRTVYQILRPCYWLFWSLWDMTLNDSFDCDFTVQYCDDIQYVCCAPYVGKYDAFEWLSKTQQDLSCFYNLIQHCDANFMLLPLQPGLYYNFSLGVIQSQNEDASDRQYIKTSILPVYGSEVNPTVHKYAVKMSYNANRLVYVSHTDEGIITL